MPIVLSVELIHTIFVNVMYDGAAMRDYVQFDTQFLIPYLGTVDVERSTEFK